MHACKQAWTAGSQGMHARVHANMCACMPKYTPTRIRAEMCRDTNTCRHVTHKRIQASTECAHVWNECKHASKRAWTSYKKKTTCNRAKKTCKHAWNAGKDACTHASYMSVTYFFRSNFRYSSVILSDILVGLISYSK